MLFRPEKQTGKPDESFCFSMPYIYAQIEHKEGHKTTSAPLV
jgi:hypothetical protein